MNSFYTTTLDPKVRAVCHAAYPAYKGLKCKVVFTTDPIDLASYWDGGTRTYFQVLELGTLKTLEVPSQHPAFDQQIKGAESFSIPPGFVVVAHDIFCGKDLGLTIYARPDGSSLLPAPATALSDLEAHVLIATAAYKSSYAGCSDYRKAELSRKYGYTSQQVDAARETLRGHGYLNARNAITNSGRNAIATHPDRYH